MWTSDKERRLEMLTDRFNEVVYRHLQKMVDERTKQLEEKLHEQHEFYTELLDATLVKEHPWFALSKVQALLLRGPKRKE